ncbi:hypothetical protein ACF0H5_014594 [Mactra antiquata]
MPRKKKDVNKPVIETISTSELKSGKCTKVKSESKSRKQQKSSSEYFSKSDEISDKPEKVTQKPKKCRKKTDVTFDAGQPAHDEEDDFDADVSQYFSPKRRQTKRNSSKTEEKKSSLASKIKSNMFHKDPGNDDTYLISAGEISDSKKKRPRTKNKKKDDDDDKTVTTRVNEPSDKHSKSKRSDKQQQMKDMDSIDEKNCKSKNKVRKRKSDDNVQVNVVKKKLRGTMNVKKTVNEDSNDDTEIDVPEASKQSSGNIECSDNVIMDSSVDNEDKPNIKNVNIESDTDDEMCDVHDDNVNLASKKDEARTQISKPVPKTVDQNDALALLMHMEGDQPTCSTNEPCTSHVLADDDDDIDGDDIDDDDDDDGWEDVADHHINSPKKSQIPQGIVEVKFDLPEIYKKRKRGEFNLEAYFKRQINKFKREVAMDIHKVHLLCLLARCQYLNNLCQEEVLTAQAFSITLVTKELNMIQSRRHTELHLNQSLSWIKQNMEYLCNVMVNSLQDISEDLRNILICVIILRQVGFITRLMTSLQPLPFKQINTKAATSKKGKLPQSDIRSIKRKSSGQCDSNSSTKKIKSETKNTKTKTRKQKVKMETDDKDELTSEPKSQKRSKTKRRCFKVSKDAYKIEKDSDFEDISDDNDEDFKPEIEELQKKVKKSGKRGESSDLKTKKDKVVKDESRSDDDFDDDSFIVRTQSLRKQSPGNKNSKILSDDDDGGDDDDDIKFGGVNNWIEVFVKKEQKWMCIDGLTLEIKKSYEIENTASQPVCYVVGITKENFIKDVTARYASQWLTETPKYRVDREWWEETLKPYLNPDKKFSDKEDEELTLNLQERPLPTSIGAFKNHPLYALRRHLLKFEAIYPDTAIPVGYIRGEPVYARECVHTLHSRENWLKEGRAVRLGEEAYKFVKSRPKWNKPKEDPEAKDLEIFGHWQTEVYIPPPAVDGKVPRNAHGNVEMFQPSMLPAGTVHLKVAGLNKVAKKLDIDCAPAMVGWEHHCGFSHPLMDGWIVCEEHKDILLAAWDEEQEIIREKEQQKREKRVYENWRKLIRGLLIKERLKKRFDLEEKPKDVAENVKDDKSCTITEEVNDLQHSWPQSRLESDKQTMCMVESM